MEQKKLSNTFLFFLLTYPSLFFVAWKIQNNLYLNNDVSSLLLFTSKLMAGGNYIIDFFTPNPPLIFFMYVPVLLMSSLLGISKLLIFRIYIFSLILLSLYLCFKIIIRIAKQIPNFPSLFFNFMLAVVLLIVPLYHFGQRDHLLLILTIPYFIGMVLQLSNERLSNVNAIAVGILAAFGFSLKPQFLIVLVLMESYYCIRKKSRFAFLRIETIIILTFLLIYILIIFIYFQNYLFTVLPYLMKFYYQSSRSTWPELFFYPPLLFCILPIITYLLQFRKKETNNVETILFVMLIGFLLSFLLQKKTNYYHLLPAFSTAILLYFSQAYTLIFTNHSQIKSKIFLFLLLTSLTPPYYIWVSFYFSGVIYKERILTPLIAFMNSQVNPKSLYFFSNNPRFGFPLIDYTHTTMAQRYDNLWMINGLVKQIQQGEIKNIAEHFRNNDYFFMQMITEDFQKNKPDYVFIDVAKNIPFNYLYFFLQNKSFHNQWRFYTYYTTIKFPELGHELLVFKRKYF